MKKTAIALVLAALATVTVSVPGVVESTAVVAGDRYCC